MTWSLDLTLSWRKWRWTVRIFKKIRKTAKYNSAREVKVFKWKKNTVENVLKVLYLFHKGTKINSSFTFVENKFDTVSKPHKLFVLKNENAGCTVVWKWYGWLSQGKAIRCCYITVDSATTALQNGACTYRCISKQMHYKTLFSHKAYMKSLEIYKNYITLFCLEKQTFWQ